MIHEKKSQSNKIFIAIAMLLFVIFIYVSIKTKGFGFLDNIFDGYLSPRFDLIENMLIFLIVCAATYN